MNAYHDFLARKSGGDVNRGIEPSSLAPHLFPYQRDTVAFCLRTGTAGLFLDTGLGKTECQLEWCQQVINAVGGRALIATPLAVAGQTRRRAERWGYPARVVRDNDGVRDGINICNYDRLDKLDVSQFTAVSLDEASILKAFSGKTTRALIEMFGATRFKLVATATPAPNDHMELGNYAEFLGIMSSMEMLSRFFINDTSQASQKWRLKGHARVAFYDWLASWARMANYPSDITGDSKDDRDFVLPDFKTIRHQAKSSDLSGFKSLNLFGAVAPSATKMYELKRQTIKSRAKEVLKIIKGSIECMTQMQEDVNGMQPIQNIAPSGDLAITNGNARNTQQIQNTENVSAEKLPSGQQENQIGRKNITDSKDMVFPPTNTEQCCKIKVEDAQFVEEPITSTLIIATQQIAFEASSVQNATGASENFETIQTDCGLPQPISKKISDWWLVWCHTNEEQKILERELGDLCFSVYGSQSAEEKEAKHEAWLRGERPVFLTKPSIFGWGCDWSHCHNMIFVGRTFSYEEWYQAVRRCWRFGQKNILHVHLVVAEGEAEIGRVIDRKTDDHANMKAEMRAAMVRASGLDVKTKTTYFPSYRARLPEWMQPVL